MVSITNKDVVCVELELNARLQPIHRDEIFEDLLENVLETYEFGEIVGSGSFLMATGEIEKCDISMNIYKKKLDDFISYLKKIDIIPKGSKIFVDEEIISVGGFEGLALYLNGADLPVEVYQDNDVNELIALLDDALCDNAYRLSYWEGATETALYFYGNDYSMMKKSLEDITKKHPLCQKCRIEKIA